MKGFAGKLVNGWMLNSIFTLQSGFPFSITSGRTIHFTGIGRDRADYIGGDASLDTGRSHGDLGRAILQHGRVRSQRHRNIRQLGQEHHSRTPILQHGFRRHQTNETGGAGRPSEFRAEFFKIFNNVMFNLPNSESVIGAVRPITSALDPRIIQFGLKVQF